MPQIPWLEGTNLDFPPVETALVEPNGLLAAGGDLSPARILEAYRNGIFPWYEEGQPILWWAPDPRIVFDPASLHISRSLRKVLRQHRFKVSMDTQFAEVIDHCAVARGPEIGTWITDEMRNAYCLLHRVGYAHSVEVWRDENLVGGLYGVALDRVFFGESMFSADSNASKVALVYLCGQLQDWGFKLIDCQVESPHLLSMGAYTMGRSEFMRLLAEYTNIEISEPSHWTLDWQPENRVSTY